MANFFSLQDGNLTDASVHGYSLTGAEIMNNTTGTMLLTSTGLYSASVNSDGSTLSAIAVHLSARSANPTGTLGLTLQRTASAGVFLDSSSNNLAITTVGSAYQNTFTPFSPNGWSAYFSNSTSSYIIAPTNNAFNFNGNPFTIEAWVYMKSVTTAGSNIFQLGTHASGVGNKFIEFGVYITGGNPTVYANIYNQSNTGYLAQPTLSGIKIGTWSHVSFVWTGTQAYVTLDGVVGTRVTATINASDFVSNGKPWIGLYYTGGTDYAFDGYISNLRVLSGTALYTSNFTPSASPLTKITGTSLLTLQDNKFKDYSNYNFNLTANGAVFIKDTSPFQQVTINPDVHGGSGYFGGNTCLNVPNIVIPIIFSIEFWYYPIVAGGYLISGVTNAFDLAWKTTNEFGIGKANVAWRLTSTTIIPVSNAWNHIAIVRTGTGTNQTTMYINGIGVSGTVADDFPNSGMLIGSYNNSVFVSSSYISNFRILSGVALYSSNFTPPSSIPNNTPNTSLLLNTRNYGVKESATETYAISSFTSYDGSNNLLTPYPQNWQILKLTNPLSTNRNDVINYTLSTSSPNQLSLVAGAVSAVDITNINKPYYTGTPFLTSVKPYSNFDDSLYFKGTTDWVVVPANPNFNLSNDFTIECWFNSSYFTGTGQSTRLFNFGANGLDALFYTSTYSNILRIDITNVNTILGTIPVADGSWHHIALVRYNGAMKLFVDGVQSGNTSNTTSTNLALGTSNPLSIGAYNNSANGQLSAAYLNNFRIVNGTAVYTTSAFTPPTTPLTNIPNTVFLMKNGARYDQTLINANSVLTGYPSVTTATLSSVTPTDPRGSYTYFDGASYVEQSINSTLLNPSSGDFTIEAWIHPLNAAGSILHINKDTTGGSIEIRFFITGSKLGTTFYGNQNGNSYKLPATTSGTIPLSTWSHVAWTRTGNITEAYINGTRILNAAMTEGCVPTDTCFTRIGRGITSAGTGDSFSYFNGYISNVRFVKGTSLYTGATINVPTSSLAATAGTNLLTLQGNEFVDNSTNKFTLNKSGTPSIFPSYIPNVNTAISINTSKYIGIANISNLSFSKMFSLEWWVYLYSNSSYEQILFVKHNGTNGIEIGVDKFDLFYIQFAASRTTANTKVPRNQWNHLAINKDSNGLISFFINGILDKTFTYTTDQSINNTAYIGTGYTGGGTCIYLLANLIGSNDVYPIYTNNFIPNNSPKLSIGTTIYLDSSSYSLSSYRYTPSVGDVNIGSSLKGLTTEPRTIQADTYSLNNLYVHNQGTLTFPLTSSKTLTLYGSAGLQITSDGTLNIGTSSSVIPLSTTHTINLSNTQIDVHNGGNLNVYGYPKLFTTNLVSDYAVGTNTFTVTDPVSSIWKVGDILTFKPNLTTRTGFDTLTIASFTGSNTLSTTSNSLFMHTGSATYANIAGVYNLNRNVNLVTPSNSIYSSIRGSDGSLINLNNIKLNNTNFHSGTTNTSLFELNSSVLSSTTLPYYNINNLGGNNYINTGGQIVINASYANQFDFSTTPLTLECWFYANLISASAETRFIMIGANALNTSIVLLNFTTDGKITAGVPFTASTSVLSPANIIKPKTWYHYALTLSGTNATIFLNGSAAATISNFTRPITLNQQTILIGYNDASATVNGQFNGYISNLRITKQVLYTSAFTPSYEFTTSSQNAIPSNVIFLGFNKFSTKLTPIIDSSLYTCRISYPVAYNNPFINYNKFNPNNGLNTNLTLDSNILLTPLSSGLDLTNCVLSNVNIKNNYILSSGGIGLQINNLSGSINMSNNRTIGSLSYGTYIANNTLSGTYGANNFNSGLQGMMISGTNTGTIVGGGLNSAKEGVYVDASTSNLSGVTFQNILTNNNSSVGFKVSGNSLNYLTPVTLNINGLITNTNLNVGFEGYNITGNLSSVVANNNYVNGIKTSIGNGSTVFDGLSSTTSTMLSTANYNTTGTQTISTNAPYTGMNALYYNGTAKNNYISINPANISFGAGDFTIEFWSYVTADNITYGSHIIGQYPRTAGSWWITRDAIVLVFDGATSSSVAVTKPALSSWNYYAFVRKSGVVTSYLNGISAAKATINYNLNNITDPIILGWNDANPYPAASFLYSVGYISNFRMTNSALYTTATFTPPTNNLPLAINTLALITNFDGTYGFPPTVLNTTSLNILSGYNYSQTVIKNAFLSATSIDSALSAAVGLKLDSTRFSRFSLDNSTISASTPIQINATRNLIEGSYLFNNTYLGSLNFIELTKYQPSVSRSLGFGFTNYNKISGNNFTYLPTGTKAIDYVVFDSTTSDQVSERLTPTSSTSKLRSSSKFVALNAGDTTIVRVNVRVSSDYNGKNPRLMLKRNPSAGIYDDTLLAPFPLENRDTFSVLVGSSAPGISAIPKVLDNCVLEFYVDCDGTTGYVCVDTWSAN